MPLDDLPGALVLPQRDSIRDTYLRDVRLRTPGAVTTEGTMEFADASVFADAMVPVYFDAKTMGDYISNTNKTGAALDIELNLAGTQRLPPAGGSGFVQVATSTGGGTIYSGDEIKNKDGLRFRCIATNVYTDGQFVPITGVDTGPSTNIAAGVALTWTFPRPGISPTAVVVEQTDGSGLSGGRDAETDDQAITRLAALRAAPPASGNDADYQKAIQETPGVSIQQGFTYAGIRGNGTMGVCFTLRPGTPGANRIPNPTQLGIVNAWLQGRFPADDGILMCSLIGSPVDLVYEVTWAPNAAGWRDVTPWPPYNAASMVVISPDTGISVTSTSFRITTSVTTVDPPIGSSIAIYDQTSGVFRIKRILSFSIVAAGATWDIVCDISNNASDTTYVPYRGQAVCPWADSLQAIVTPSTEFFDTIGPGEQIDPIPDPNLRMRRSPRSPAAYANAITNRITSPLFDLPAVNDIQLVAPVVPFHTPVGAPGVVSQLLELRNITVFPQPL
jgi:hypothetical protein